MRDPRALIDTATLAASLGDPTLRVFDCTTYLEPTPAGSSEPYIAVPGAKTFEAGHVPGADFLDLQGEFSDTGTHLHFMMPPVAQLEAAFGRHGVGPGARVVLYSIGTMMWATRFWWMLQSLGFDASVLDGGLDKWKAENRPLATEETIHPPATLTLRGRPEIFVDKKAVKAAIGQAGTLTLNALSHDQHTGRGGVTYGRPGRIAGSSCVPAASLFAPDKTLKPIADLRAAFEGVGAAPDKRVLVYCGGGIAASLDAFVLTALLGHTNVAVYDNSMQEWSNDPKLPMEVG